MLSMTGYGKAVYRDAKKSVEVEISSVNNRFLEIAVRLPRELSGLEPRVREEIAAKISRGKINIGIYVEDNGLAVNSLVLNKSITEDIYRQLKELKSKYKLEGNLSLNHFLSFPDIFKVTTVDSFGDKIWPSVKKTLHKALNDLISMRKKEGINLKKDIQGRIKGLSATIKEVEKLLVMNKSLIRDRLTVRIKEIIDRQLLDSFRLEEEIAYLVDRSDITEEVVRFKSHLRQFQTSLRGSGPVGKKLNFILQELNRETNTIGSKAANSDIAGIVVEIKEEIEKIREQLQNIE
jgi:uncharacterized protein (TIGR00255 family)